MIPTTSDQREDLRRLIGRWHGSERMMASRWASGGPAESLVETELALGGAYIFQNYRQSRQDATSFEARAVFGYDEARKQPAMYLFDAMGFPPSAPAYGVLEGEHLIFTRSSPRGQGQHRFRFDEGSYSLVVRFAPPDGPWETVMEGLYKLVPFA